MRISDLQYFLKVAELHSISKAAEQLYITQQGLSRIIGSIEKELGVILFSRGTNSIELTEIGQAVLTHAKAMVQEHLELLQTVNSYQTAELSSSEYTIYATPVICITLLPKIFLRLYRKYPNVHFNVIEMLPLMIIDKTELTENGIGVVSISDFLYRQSTRLLRDSLRYEVGFEDILMLNTFKDSPLAKKAQVSVAELAQTPIAMYNTETMMLEYLLEGENNNVVVHTTNHELCRSMVSTGLASGITSALLEYYCPSENTVMVPLERTITLTYGCVYDATCEDNPITKDIRELVREELAMCTKWMKKKTSN